MSQEDFPLIYIVEDNELFVKMVEEHLKSNKLSNYKSFSSGEECLNNLDNNPNIILMDYELGGRDGIQMLQKIKKYHSNIYVIMLTSSENLEIALKALQEGAYDFIHKDKLSFKLLKSIIGKIIANHNNGIHETTNYEMTGFKQFLKF